MIVIIEYHCILVGLFSKLSMAEIIELVVYIIGDVKLRWLQRPY